MMKNKICLPLIASVALAGLPSTSFARWMPAQCAQVSTDYYIKNQQGQIEAPSQDATFEISCYNASGELVRRVMHYSVSKSPHWSTAEESLDLGGKLEAYMETSLGKTVFVASAVGLGLVGSRVMRSVEARIDAKYPSPSNLETAAETDLVADAAALDSGAPAVRGPRPFAIRLLDPAKLNVTYTTEPIQVSRLVLSADVIPAGLRWRTYEDGSRWIIMRQRVSGVSEIQPGTTFEAVRIDTTTNGVRTAPEGDWASTPWTKEAYEILADPAELRATYRPEPAVETPPATFAIPGEADATTPVAPEAPTFSVEPSQPSLPE